MPVTRKDNRKAAPGRRQAPTQARRNAAAAPSRAAVAEADPAEAFEGQDDDQEQEYDEDDLPEIIDLSSAKAPDNSVWARGWYDGVVEEVEYGLSQGKGLPMLTFHIRCTHPDEVDDDNEPKTRVFRWYLTLAGDAAGRSKAQLAELDPELDLSTLAPNDMDEYFADAAVRVRLTIRPDRDDRKIKRNNIAAVKPLDDEDFEEAE